MTDRQRIALSFRDADRAEPYRKALQAAGLESISFTPDLPASLNGVAGLVVTGGHDVDPALFGAAPHLETDEPDRAHDDYEAAILRAALSKDLPVLAICRGMQLFNVALGGTLVQHLPGTPKHRQRTGGTPVHEVLVDPLLADIFGAPRIAVNSRHHQAVDRPGIDVFIAARDPQDDVAEAVTIPGARFAVGVQWHPEDMVEDPVQLRLFHAFARAVQP
jgi:putative glutamine amidotransferase